MSYAEVLAAAQTLSWDEQHRLVDELGRGIDDCPPGVLVGDEFDAELRRRLEEVRGGKAEMIPWDTVRERIEAKLVRTRANEC